MYNFIAAVRTELRPQAQLNSAHSRTIFKAKLHPSCRHISVESRFVECCIVHQFPGPDQFHHFCKHGLLRNLPLSKPLSLLSLVVEVVQNPGLASAVFLFPVLVQGVNHLCFICGRHVIPPVRVNNFCLFVAGTELWGHLSFLVNSILL